MCLAIPGKILSVEDQLGARVAKIEFGGVTREGRLDFVPEANVGDYVIVHVGFAISRLDAEEAKRTYELLSRTGLLAEEGLTADQ